MKKSYFILILLCFLSCKKNSDEIQEQSNIESLQKRRISEGWKTYSDDIIRTLIPSDWIPKKKDDMLFLVPIDKKLNLYYAVIEYNLKTVVSSKNYIKEIFKQFDSDVKQFVYTMRRVDLTNGNAFYLLEFYTTESNHKYKTYIVVYPKNNSIYDFGFKTLDNIDSNSKNQKMFYDILLTFEHHNEKVIDSENFIVEDAVEIKYDDL